MNVFGITPIFVVDGLSPRDIRIAKLDDAKAITPKFSRDRERLSSHSPMCELSASP